MYDGIKGRFAIIWDCHPKGSKDDNMEWKWKSAVEKNEVPENLFIDIQNKDVLNMVVLSNVNLEKDG